MGNARDLSLEKRLNSLKIRFNSWRAQKKSVYEPIPEKLWGEVVQLALDFGTETQGQVASALKVHHGRFTARVEAARRANKANDAKKESKLEAAEARHPLAEAKDATPKTPQLSRRRKLRARPIRVTRYDFDSLPEQLSTTSDSNARKVDEPIDNPKLGSQENRSPINSNLDLKATPYSICVRFRELEMMFSSSTPGDKIHETVQIALGSVYQNGGYLDATNFSR
jgi:hypothetical protein